MDSDLISKVIPKANWHVSLDQMAWWFAFIYKNTSVVVKNGIT